MTLLCQFYCHPRDIPSSLLPQDHTGPHLASGDGGRGLIFIQGSCSGQSGAEKGLRGAESPRTCLLLISVTQFLICKMRMIPPYLTRGVVKMISVMFGTVIILICQGRVMCETKIRTLNSLDLLQKDSGGVGQGTQQTHLKFFKV